MDDDNDDGPPLGEVAPPTLLGLMTVGVPMAGACSCLAILWRGMVAVMDVGGQCSDGSMYAGAVSCPKGTGWMMPFSVIVGLGLVGLYALRANLEKAPNYAILFWPALFWSLGWNFISVPSGTRGGPWLMGAMFGAMGAAPVFGLAVTAFPNLGSWLASLVRPVIRIGRSLNEPSAQWGKDAGPESSQVRQDAPALASAPVANRLYRGDPAAFRAWTAMQAAFCALGVRGGIAFFEWASR